GAGEKLMYSHDGGATWTDITSAVSGTGVSYADASLTSTTTIEMRVEDAAGNVGTVASQLVTIDTTAPTTTVAITGISLDTGTPGDFITNDTDGLTISATLSKALASDERLQYSDDGGNTWVDISSSVTGTAVSYFDAALTQSTTVKMRVVDVAGNDGTATQQAITIDTTAPTTTVAITGISLDTGTPGDFITNDNDGLTVSATLSKALVSGEKLMYSDDGGSTWTDISSSVSGTNVNYFDAALTSSATVEMRVVDTAGNAGAAASQDITILTNGPATTVAITGISQDTGTPGDFITNDTDGLTVSATLSQALAAGQKLMYSHDGGASWIDISTSVTGTTVNYVDTALTSSATVEFHVMDTAGNVGPTASQDITIIGDRPSTTVNITGISQDTGTPGDFITSDNDGLTVSASLSTSLASGEKLLYSTDGKTWTDITSSVSGTDVSYADASLTSTKTVYMKVEDVAGGDGPQASQLVTIDTIAPVTTVAITGISQDTGTPGDFITSDNDGLAVQATLSQALGAGEKLMYSHDGGATWTDITAAVSGTGVNYFDAALTSSATVEMRVVDTAGNTGATASQAITIDITPPAVTVDITGISPDTGTVGDFITSATTGLAVQATLSQALGAGDHLMYSRDNGATWVDITAAVAGTVVNYADAALTSSTTIEMRVVDAAGNAGQLDSQAITIVGTGPSTAVHITGISQDTGTPGDFITNDNDGLTVSATLSTSLASGEKLLYSTDGKTW
ncbi:hypothetical protein CIC12_32730, partial [Burkholderia sp. SG-MS1]|uniref:beta strand repeat-containing protein n=1 Tax=Paraburkholderia sp. SG-MS1 TaxID=2023741 RepID=UPI001580939B